MSSLDQHIGRRTSDRREALGLSVGHVATHVGLTADELLRCEAGSRRIAAHELFLLSGVLQVRVTYFFEGYACKLGSEASGEQIERILSVFKRISSNDVRNYVIEISETIVLTGVGGTTALPPS